MAVQITVSTANHSSTSVRAVAITVSTANHSSTSVKTVAITVSTANHSFTYVRNVQKKIDGAFEWGSNSELTSNQIKFDVSMGAFDEAEVCELIGLHP